MRPVSGIDYADLPMYRGALADAVGFSDADLESNRAGRLSQSQRASLMREDRIRIGFVVLCAVVAVVSFVIALTFGPGNIKALKGWALTAFFVLAAGLGIVSAQKLWRDLRSGVVRAVEGFVTSTMQQSGSAQEYYWVVGDQRFSVTGDMYTILEPGRYRLYMLPRTRHIVSIEPTTAGK